MQIQYRNPNTAYKISTRPTLDSAAMTEVRGSPPCIAKRGGLMAHQSSVMTSHSAAVTATKPYHNCNEIKVNPTGNTITSRTVQEMQNGGTAADTSTAAFHHILAKTHEHRAGR